MRLLGIIALVVGAVASQPLFQAGKEYEFNYQGKMLTGIPKLESHYAGLTMSGKVILQVSTNNTFKLALKHVRLTQFNEKLSGPEPENWRLLGTPQTEEIPSEYETILASPVEFTMVGGEVREIKAFKEEPEWSLNYKKSLISMLKIQSSTGRNSMSHNSVRPETGSLPDMWKTMEQGIDGECENQYQISEVPIYMLSEITFNKVNMEKCEGKKVFQITKTRDVEKCTMSTAYGFHQPGKLSCEGGNCDGMVTRTSVTRYAGCGSSVEDMEVQVILNEGELLQNLMAYNTENVLTGTRQTLMLVETRTRMTTLPEISSPKSFEDLYYEYPRLIDLRGRHSERSHSSFEEQQQVLREQQPSVLRFVPRLEESVMKKLSPSTLRQKIVEKIIKVVGDLNEVEHYEKKQVSAQVVSISQVMALLNRDDIKSIYEEVQRANIDTQTREMARQLTLEITTVTGTNPSLMFLKEMIESEEFSPVRTAEVIATIPHYIQTPTIEMMDQLFELIKSPVVNRHGLLRTNARLAFATLINKACIDPQRVYRFPVHVYGEFCNSQTSKLTSSYIPYFAEELKSSSKTPFEKESYIYALGTIGHESVIDILLPYIQGDVSDITPSQQRTAITSLIAVGRHHREKLMPVVSSIFFSPSESREVRLAAFHMMLHLEPSLVEFQKIATSTWFEKDSEIHKMVFSVLKTLSTVEVTEIPEPSKFLHRMNVKAGVVYTLAKPVPGIISSSLAGFTSEWLKQLEVGYYMIGSYTTIGKNIDIYGKLEYFMEKVNFSPVEFWFNSPAPRTLVEKIREIIGERESILEKIHPEWKSIIETIELKAREETPFSIGAWARLFNDVQFAAGMDMSILEHLVRSVEMSLMEPKELKEKLCGKTPISFVKINNWAKSEYVIASDMGLPTIVEFNMPSVYAVKGDIDIDCSTSLPKITLDVAKKTSVNMVGHTGTIDPISKEVLAVGINQEWTVNYPSKISVGMEMGKLKIEFAENQYVTPSTQEVDLLTYSVKPFAVTKPSVWIDLTPMVDHPNTKIIRSNDERITQVLPFGETFGLSMKFEMETESDVTDVKSFLDFMRLYKFSPLNVALLSNTNTAITEDGKASCRFHEVKMTYNPQQSSTKRAEIEFGVTMVRKDREAPLKKINFGVQSQQQQIQQHQKLESKIKKLTIEEGFGLTTSLDVKFEGGERKTYSWELTACHGHSGVEQKWGLHLENKESLNICVDGSLTLPNLPLRESYSLRYSSPRFSYKNIIGFGNTCQENRIKVVGTTSTSDDLKLKSSGSWSTKKCTAATREVEEIREKLRTTRDEESSEYRHLEKDLIKMIEEKNEYCRRQFRELSTLDEVDFKIEYTPMPEYVKRYFRLLDASLKITLLPYITKIGGGNNRNLIDVDLKFNPYRNTMNMELTTETESVRFSQIHLPEELKGVFPLRSTEQAHKQVLSIIQGEPSLERCTIGQTAIHTFDNSTYRYELDDCYHVLSSDCDRTHSHAVLAKEENGLKYMKTFDGGSKITMEPARSYSDSHKEYEVTLDGKSIELERNQRKHLVSENGKVVFTILRSADDVLDLETPHTRIIYNGKTIEVEPLNCMHTQCGLCGNNDNNKMIELQTARACIAQSAQQAALSYRVQQACSAPSAQQIRIKNQRVTCTRPQVKPSPLLIVPTYQQTKHSMIRQAGRLCISQIPIVECVNGSVAKSTVTRPVAYTCLPTNRKRVSELYHEKVRSGEVLPELRNMEKTFEAEMKVPLGCSHPAY